MRERRESIAQLKCRVCQSESVAFATAEVLGHVPVEYSCCRDCGFVQTQDPTWLDEAYSESIAASDIGLLGRNLHLREVTSALIQRAFNPAGRFLDYGGGYGVFVRLMRDRGFDFRWEDPFCKNLFAADHEHQAGERYELVTAFEVFEHLPDPGAGLAAMVERSENVFFSTDLLPPGPPQPKDWWYYALDSGQHVALYTRAALGKLGERHGLRLLTNGRNLHLLTRRNISRLWFRLACSGRLAPWLSRWGRRPSLQAKDHREVLARLRGR
jgi:hypothetical protein